MHGLVKTKILYILPDVPFLQSCSALGMVIFRMWINTQIAVHIKNEKQTRSKCTFKISAGSLTGCSKPTMKGQILKSEILQALNMVDKNHTSAIGDSDRFKKMFPDLQIVTKYSQEEIKSKYVVQLGLDPFVKDELTTDV